MFIAALENGRCKKFYQILVNNDFVEIIDLLLARYDMQYFSKLPLSMGIKLIYKAYEKRREEQYWDIWLTKYPYMDKENYVSFEDFYKKDNYYKTNKSKKKRATKEELLKMNQEIVNKVQQGYYIEKK